jgi:poly-gamma-glutamate capsule biosynthesis protein CapA/YwtB (metallophosphatase superfamily)
LGAVPLTRRSVAPSALLVVALTLFVTACFGDDDRGRRDEAASESIELRGLESLGDPGLEETVRAAAIGIAADLGLAVRFSGPVSGASSESVTVGRMSTGELSAEAVVRYWGAFAGFWSERTSLDLATLQTETALLLPQEYQSALSHILANAPSQTRWLPAAALAAAINGQPGSVAVLPLELGSTQLRSLSVGGVDLVRGVGRPEESPLVERLFFSWEDESMAGFARRLSERVSQPPPAVVRTLFSGDIIPARCVYARHLARNDFTSAFRGTKETLAAADVTVGSLDASISDVATPIGCIETFNLMAPARSMEGIAAAGFDVMTVASNHVKDCGSQGSCDRAFLDTLTNLEGAGIATVGGGRDLNAAHQPAVIERKGVKFAFLGYDDIAASALGAGEDRPGTAALSSDALKRDIAAAKATADVVIVLAQWGTEYTPDATLRQQELAAVAVEAGASLVVGNHPHVVQGLEWPRDSLIAYALGNFVFDQDWSLETQQGVVMEVVFHGARAVGARLLPHRIVDDHRPEWASPSEGRSILERMRVASDKLEGP